MSEPHIKRKPTEDAPKGSVKARGEALRARGATFLDSLEEKRPRHASIEVGFRWLLRDKEIAGGVLGGGLAYRFFFWGLAWSVLVAGGLGFASSSGANVASGGKDTGLTESLASTVATAAKQSETGRWWLVLSGMMLVLWFSFGLLRALRLVHAAAWRIPAPPLRNLPRAIGFVVAAPLVLLAGSTFSGWVRANTAEPVGLLATLGLIACFGAVWLWVSMLLPSKDVPWTAFLPGAILFGLGSEALYLLAAYYLQIKLANASELYGALGLATTTLFSLYLIGRGVIWAAELNAIVWDVGNERRTSPGNLPAPPRTASSVMGTGRDVRGRGRRRSPLRRALRPVLLVVALVLVFVWLLPQFIDYEEVWEALTQLDAWEVVVLFALGLARVPTEAVMYRAFLPGLSLRRGSEAYLSSNFAGQLLPPPTASVVQYGYFRGGGHSSDAAGLAAFGSFLFPTIGRFLLPFVALVLLLLTAEADGTVVLVGALSLAVTAVAGIVGYVFMRRERSARWIGAMTQRPLSWILVKVKRDPIEDGAAKAAGLRTRALGVLHEGWALGSIGVAANLFLTYLILLASLRFVGVSSAELSAADAFAAFAIAFWAGAVFPITGSGLGVVDAVLIAMLIELSGASDDALVAAALLWRVFYSVLTLPLGAITLGRFRKATPNVLPGGTVETT